MQEGEIRLGIRHRLPVKDLKIMGPHNYSNVMAALLAADALTNDIANLIDAARAFMPLTHRLEFVADINGVLFFNDSKATNTDSVRSALLSFDKPIRIIMGGSDKGEDFSVLTELLKQKTKKVYVTGDTAPQMEKLWKDQMDLEHVPDFEDCIRKAWQDSQTGDIVVLSPACASFDRFRNFEHRGDVFKSIVEKMANEV
jgi:UDP-N-acetylmuramoylalanine--D-glutamate ligase